MTLSDNRDKLQNDFEWTRQRYDSLDLVKKIFKMVRQQDKEAIKELKTNKIYTMDANALAELMHNKYEKISNELNWETQNKCKVDFKDLPKENKNVMINMAIWLITYFSGIFGKLQDKDVDKIFGEKLTGVKNDTTRTSNRKAD